ncbi:hypothetical protein [Actinopolyspora mzabensis]|uniref:hypothetical protein n=1 Tax=Actinopolyspora mzabensis TaxID=995066 RepID=UPI00115F7E05|nr:hypothetical protein [Actinopolyspora mzabensis]
MYVRDRTEFYGVVSMEVMAQIALPGDAGGPVFVVELAEMGDAPGVPRRSRTNEWSAGRTRRRQLPRPPGPGTPDSARRARPGDAGYGHPRVVYVVNIT